MKSLLKVSCVMLITLSACRDDSAGPAVPQPPPPAVPPPAAPPIEITITPANADLLPQQTQRFACFVSGSMNTQCLWSVQTASGEATDAGGTIDASGLYTAPASPGMVRVVAAAAADRSRVAYAAVRVGARTGSNENKVRPGLGDDPGSPLVTQIVLPAGMRTDGQIIGADAGTSCPDADVQVGSGAAVVACVSICGPGGEIELPPGLMITSDTGEGQNGLLVENVYFTAPPTLCTGGPRRDETDEERRRRYIVQINSYCLNESRSPSFAWMTYTLSGRTQDADVLELIAILARKRVETEAHGELVQEAIYEITEGRGLTTTTRNRLEAVLPSSQA